MKLDKMMLVRTIVMIFALVNQVLVMCGLSPIPYDNEQVEYIVTSFITVGTTLWVWFKNNSITMNARKADEHLKELKNKNK